MVVVCFDLGVKLRSIDRAPWVLICFVKFYRVLWESANNEHNIQIDRMS